MHITKSTITYIILYLLVFACMVKMIDRVVFCSADWQCSEWLL